jgi:hypothetical protein
LIADLRRMAEEAREGGEEVFIALIPCPQHPHRRGGQEARRVLRGGHRRLFPDSKVDLDHLNRCLVLIRFLQERGYTLCCDRGLAVSAEREMNTDELEGEAAAVGVSARAAMG